MNYYSQNTMAPNPSMSGVGYSPTPTAPMLPPTGTTSPVLPTYAHGGHTTPHHARHNLILAHFGSPELEVMDRAQGGAVYDRSTGLKVYKKLDKHLSNMLEHPHTKEIVMEAIRSHKSQGGGMAHGGHAESMSHMGHEGRHGDTKMAYITQDLMHLLDHLSGHHPRNPHTGYPEYWSLGGFFSKLAPAIGRGASSIGRGLGSVGSSIGRGVSSIGSSLGRHAAAAMPSIKQGVSNFVGAAPEGGWGKHLASAAGTGLANMAAAKLGGADWGDAAKMGALAGTSGFNTPAASVARNALTTSLQGGNTRDSLLSGLSGGAGHYDTALGRGVQTAANMGLNGGNTKDMALAGLGAAGAGSNNAALRGLGTAANAHLGGANVQDSILHGGLAALGHPGVPTQPQPEHMPEEEHPQAAAMAHGGRAYYYN